MTGDFIIMGWIKRVHQRVDSVFADVGSIMVKECSTAFNRVRDRRKDLLIDTFSDDAILLWLAS